MTRLLASRQQYIQQQVFSLAEALRLWKCFRGVFVHSTFFTLLSGFVKRVGGRGSGLFGLRCWEAYNFKKLVFEGTNRCL